MARNPYEEEGRRLKVSRLLTVIDEAGPVTADEAASWTSATWRDVTDTANAVFGSRMKEPSVVTRALVVEAIRQRETDRGAVANVRSLAEARARRAS